ncbi:hypothetical protein ACOI9A_11585, partial [Corynebacterium amycolatum]|uniref:hypothetical protein n=1 Tax=Corynebacterium amycolatum TaxID=43765 RepID=UPI003B596E83
NYPNPGRNAGHNHKPLEVSKTSMDSVSKKTPDSMSKNPMDITYLVWAVFTVVITNSNHQSRHIGELLPISWTEKSVTDSWGVAFIESTKFAK